jgi:DNA-binding transcriptional LysR family regulator
MDKLLSMRAFADVARLGGFSRAARGMRVATSSVTRLVDALEGSLGTPLLNRTTRRVTLTDAGVSYLEHVLRILAEVEEADQSVADTGNEPVGPLRVSMPVTYGRLFFGPRIPAFLESHPKVSLDLILADAAVDLAAERVDLAVTIGELWLQSNAKVRKLGEQRRFVVVSQDYLSRRGVPEHPSDLSGHECFRFSHALLSPRWTFHRDGVVEHVDVKGRLAVNASDVLRETVLAGQGIALLPEWLVGPDVRTGRLRRLFEEYAVNPHDISASVYASYLPNREHSRKVQALVTFLEQQITSLPEI